MEIKNTTRQ